MTGADLSVARGRSGAQARHTHDVMCDTPGKIADECLRPGNFKIVIQNIWYLFGLSDTRCSVSNTDRPPQFPNLHGSAGGQKSAGVGSQTPRTAASDRRNFEGLRAAEIQWDVVPEK
ncbi:hypothetical protein MGAD_19060 [Mycolicibacterium gadium]|uniref:Uncharacterized protein n=1 Tax=Mycolicibacterium gadium TaxID=1794 RepID=A0A7I7WLZ3_MYCGU|nr:hypothetical protein MGAD_19060 [Mycolicibacterium gadium]